MNGTFKSMWKVAVVAAVLSLACCGGGQQVSIPNAVNNEFVGAPVWVTGNCAKYLKKDTVCATGSTGGTRNASLARSAAEADGRTNIARILQTQVKSMIKSYAATTTGGAEFGKEANDEQHIENVSKQLTDMTLSGVTDEETWISSSGTFYALMSLDVAAFKAKVSGMGQLSEAVRRAVVERADKAFGELNAETAPK